MGKFVWACNPILVGKQPAVRRHGRAALETRPPTVAARPSRPRTLGTEFALLRHAAPQKATCPCFETLRQSAAHWYEAVLKLSSGPLHQEESVLRREIRTCATSKPHLHRRGNERRCETEGALCPTSGQRTSSWVLIHARELWVLPSPCWIFAL